MPDDFLQKVCKELEFESGAGWYPLATSDSRTFPAQIGWLEQARKLGAESVFFVKEHPAVLFFKLDSEIDADTETVENEIRQLHLKTWNTSRVPLFFVALPNEMRVYSAYQKPARDAEEWRSEDRWLKRIKTAAKIGELQAFSRPQIESGNLFYQRSEDFDPELRADQCLLRNLRLLRRELEGPEGKNRKYAHALISRSLFIRYLEDRKILTEDDFADKTVSRDRAYRCYTDVLTSKADTCHLFHKLNDMFGSDLFPLKATEEKAIREVHLGLLRDFLLGKSMGGQLYLFFWAYKFDIIPIELLSNIFEEFYHEHRGKADITPRCTPMPLVDFVLSRTLTPEKLDTAPRVLDASCGSGVFLIEAFKRMVFHECRRQGVSRLPRATLTELLTERVAGTDVSESAIQTTAFGLYLTFLDFLEPEDIRSDKQLPRLIWHPETSDTGRVLFCVNAFSPTPAEQEELKAYLRENKRYKQRWNDVSVCKTPALPLDNARFDVIVGDPPWGPARRSGVQLPIRWCKAFRHPVSDKRLSQCFVWRVRQLLKPDGTIGLLIPTDVLFRHKDKNRAFRNQWLKQNRIREIYHFAHVRQAFFRKEKKTIMPFAAVFFAPAPTAEAMENRITYVSVKRNAFVEQIQHVVINKADFQKVRQSEFAGNEQLWKTYMWGGKRDAQLIEVLKSRCILLEDVVSDYGSGYQESGISKKRHARELAVDFELKTDLFYQNAEFSKLREPLKDRPIQGLGNPELFKGPRLLMKRGIPRSGQKFGEIQARLAYDPFAFRNTIIGFRIDEMNEADHKILLGIMLSSLAKYYHFLTCSAWGFRNYDILADEHLALPILLTDNQELKTRIITAVEHLTKKGDTHALSGRLDWQIARESLDNAVFDLYKLSGEQRDLVRDLCQVTLELFYNGTKSRALRSADMKCLESYRDAFMTVWHEHSGLKEKELEVRIYAPPHGLLCGISCDLKDLGTEAFDEPVRNHPEWKQWFGHLNKFLRKKYSDGIYIDRVVKVLDGSSMFIIKRAERRFWTRSQARQDVYELLPSSKRD